LEPSNILRRIFVEDPVECQDLFDIETCEKNKSGPARGRALCREEQLKKELKKPRWLMIR